MAVVELIFKICEKIESLVFFCFWLFPVVNLLRLSTIREIFPIGGFCRVRKERTNDSLFFFWKNMCTYIENFLDPVLKNGLFFKDV